MKTRAGLFRAVGEPLEVVELDLAEPGPDDVVVRMAAVGICGTDLHQVKGEWQRPTPMVLGHEGAGIVEDAGDAVTSVRVGDEVVLSWAPSCGQCADCARGRPAACVPLHRAIGNGTLVDGTTGMSLGGETVYRGTATGAWAERVVVTSQVALPTGGAVPLRDAALLGCAALTGVGAVLFAARAEPGGVALVSAPAEWASSSSRARASPGPRRSSSPIRSRRGVSRRSGSAPRTPCIPTT